MRDSEIERKAANVSQEASPSPWARSPKDLFGSPSTNQPIAERKYIGVQNARSVGNSEGSGAIHELIFYDLDRTGKGGGKIGSDSDALASKMLDKTESPNGNTPMSSDVTLASDSNTRRGSHGEIITKLPGGVTTTDYPDGTSVIDTPETRHTTRPDGTRTVVDKITGRITTFVPPNVDPKGEGFRVDEMPDKPPEHHPYNWQPPVIPRWQQNHKELEEEHRRRQKHLREEFIRPPGGIFPFPPTFEKA
jgi:hypothetical protein